MTNISSVEHNVTTCCIVDEVHKRFSTCYWNVSSPTFSTDETIIPKTYNQHCRSNVICYPDFYSTDVVGTNDAVYMSCRRSTGDVCFLSHAIENGSFTAEALASACESYINWIIQKDKYDKAYFNDETVVITGDDILFIVQLCISLPFFVATFVVYMILPELKNLHGLVLRIYLSCCFVGYATYVFMIIRPVTGCYSPIAFIRHFAFLAAFFWLNVMCFDIWWAFRSPNSSTRQSFRKKWIFYSIYAWGNSMLIIAVGLILELVPNLGEGVIKPGIHAGCWVANERAKFMYLFVPMAITLVFNTCFFAAAAVSICRQKNDAAQRLESGDSKRHNVEKGRFYLYLKLFVVMGVQWVVEILDMVGLDGPDYAGVILELPIMLQGPILFVILVWNDRIKRLLSARFRRKDWRSIHWIEVISARIQNRTQQPQA